MNKSRKITSVVQFRGFRNCIVCRYFSFIKSTCLLLDNYLRCYIKYYVRREIHFRCLHFFCGHHYYLFHVMIIAEDNIILWGGGVKSDPFWGSNTLRTLCARNKWLLNEPMKEGVVPRIYHQVAVFPKPRPLSCSNPALASCPTLVIFCLEQDPRLLPGLTGP